MKILSIIILIVLVADIVLPFLLAIPYKGYNHKTTVMSALGAKQSPLRFLYNGWTVISGIVFLLFGIVLFRYYGGSYKGLSIATGVLLALYGLGCEIISGFFPVNESADEKTLSSVVHGIGSVIGFTALLFSPLLLGILQLKCEEIIIGTVSIVFFVLSFASFAAFVAGDKPKFENTVISLSGLWQRISMYTMYAPLIIFILKFLIEESV